MTLRPIHALAAILLFATEIAIARFAHDAILRPYGGDSLAVALVYCGLRAVTPLRPFGAAMAALAIGCAIEIGQLVHVLDLLGLGSNRLARIVLGSDFEWRDFGAYAVGAAGALAGERLCVAVAPARPRLFLDRPAD